MVWSKVSRWIGSVMIQSKVGETAGFGCTILTIKLGFSGVHKID